MSSPSPLPDPASSPDVSVGPDGRRRWHVGALTYTFGGIVVLFCWLLWGDFAWSLKERSVVPMAQLFLRRFHASDTLNGLLVGTLPFAIAAILQPIVSYRSDRHRGRWGRRIPYLLWTTPIAAAGMIGVGLAPRLASWLDGALGPHSPGLSSLALGLFGAFWLLFEFGQLVTNVIFLALINDVVPAQFLGRFFGLFRALSLSAGILFNYFILKFAESHFELILVILAGIYFAALILMCVRVHEGDYPPPPPRGPSAGFAGFLTATRSYLRECFSNSYYVWIFVAYNLGFVAFAPVNLYSLFYAKSIDMSLDTFGKLVALTYAFSLVLSYFLGMAADRFHPLRVGIFTSAAYAALALWGGFGIHDTRTFAFAFVAHGVLSGCFFTTTASLGQRLFPRARFAQFYSALLIVQAVGMMFVPIIIGRILDATHHAYQLTFLASGILSLLAVAASLVVYRRFIALGGLRHYQAPE
ncbi:MFS transporter [Horticoccus luteus]|uniref:MFS transporter n=1 Tax=Horticoccus luteus TaxID=2862869 RepID=A0A8F9TUZ0_9BACT|nr:MFS transporter [Horticoccus luteus]QYM79591.1 MFS transporter [Horticoccus luteus]